jgi:hypothetical protein
MPAYLLALGWPRSTEVSERGRGFGIRIVGLMGMTNPTRDPYDASGSWALCVACRCGWPLPCLEWHQHGTAGPDSERLLRPLLTNATARRFGGLPYPSWIPMRGQRRGHRIPLAVEPAAAAANTLFYALVLLAAVRGPGAIRRTIRRARGRCPACAYPTGSSPVCTECGRALRCATPRPPDGTLSSLNPEP